MWDSQSLYKYFLELLDRHRGKAIGIILGLLAGLLIVIFGFWKMILIIICILFGYFIGKSFDDGGSLDALWRRLFGER